MESNTVIAKFNAIVTAFIKCGLSGHGLSKALQTILINDYVFSLEELELLKAEDLIDDRLLLKRV